MAKQLESPDDRIRCGDMWDTGCMAWVQAPSFGHGAHPTPQKLAEHLNIYPDVRQDILRHYYETAGEVMVEVVKNPNCPIDLLYEAARHPNSDVRLGVLQNQNCPADILVRTAANWSEWHTAKRNIAGHRNCPPDLIQQIYGQHSNDVRICYVVAANPSTRPELLRHLSEKGGDSGLCGWVARNPSCPPDVLNRLATNPHSAVRHGVAANRSISPELAKQFALNEDTRQLWYLASNPSCPPEVLVGIVRDGRNSRACDAALRNPAFPPHLRDMFDVLGS